MSKTYLFLGGPKNGKLMDIPDHMVINGQIGARVTKTSEHYVASGIFIYETHEMLDAEGQGQLCATVPGETLPTPEQLTEILSR